MATQKTQSTLSIIITHHTNWENHQENHRTQFDSFPTIHSILPPPPTLIMDYKWDVSIPKYCKYDKRAITSILCIHHKSNNLVSHIFLPTIKLAIDTLYSLYTNPQKSKVNLNTKWSHTPPGPITSFSPITPTTSHTPHHNLPSRLTLTTPSP